MPEAPTEPAFPKHFDGKRFYNPDAPQARGFLDFLRWARTSHKEPSPQFIADVVQSTPLRRVEGDELRVTLVNHSTVLLQQKEANILTDPIWSDRVSPLASIGPRRKRAPGVAQEVLPGIDVVLISHNHYDHLDAPTLRWLSKRGGSIFVVPKGVGRFLQSRKMGPVFELDWGESHQHNALTIHCVPALHFSARGLFDRNKTLWCGYVIQSRERTVYFAGDTAYGNHFSLIRKRFGAPSLSLLPIGAYDPRWFMSPIHMDPREAVQAHEILASKASVAIHHGTFQLADEGIDRAAETLASLPKPGSFLILKNGESAVIIE